MHRKTNRGRGTDGQTGGWADRCTETHMSRTDTETKPQANGDREGPGKGAGEETGEGTREQRS